MLSLQYLTVSETCRASMQCCIQLSSVCKGVKSEVTPLGLDLSEVTKTCSGGVCVFPQGTLSIKRHYKL